MKSSILALLIVVVAQFGFSQTPAIKPSVSIKTATTTFAVDSIPVAAYIKNNRYLTFSVYNPSTSVNLYVFWGKSWADTSGYNIVPPQTLVQYNLDGATWIVWISTRSASSTITDRIINFY